MNHASALALVAAWLPALAANGWTAGSVRVLCVVDGEVVVAPRATAPRGVVLPEGSRAVLVANIEHGRPVVVVERADGSLVATDGPRTRVLGHEKDHVIVALETAPGSSRFDVVRRRTVEEVLARGVAEHELTGWAPRRRGRKPHA